MALTLSAAEVARLETALETAASPLSFHDVGAWRLALRAAVEPLVGATSSISWLPLDGEPLIEFPPDQIAAFTAYAIHFHGRDPGIERWRRDKHEVAAFRMVYDLRDRRARELLFEFGIPYGLEDCVFLAADTGAPFPAALVLYVPGNPAPAVTAHRLALLRLVLPAYKAGMHHCVRLARRREGLGRLVDALPDGAALCDASGRLAHANPALARQLADDREGERLEAEIARVAASVGGLAERRRLKSRRDGPGCDGALSELRTASARYRLHASHLGRELLGRDATVVVLVARLAVAAPTAVPTAAELYARFGLTAREREVADLLARGRSNAEVAGALGVSPATARHYTEHVLAKLGVRSRAGVGARLRGEAPDA